MSQATNNFLDILAISRIVVVLRHITLNQCEEYIALLEENNLNTIEITLNSINAFESIELIAKKFPKINLGAGTVIEKNSINKLSDLGVKFIVSPDTNPEIITETLKKNLVSIPGFYTATEAFKAIRYGSTILKFFPASQNGIQLINDYSAVLPSNIHIIPTGGINKENIKQFLSKSIAVGIGNSLFSSNVSLSEFSDRIKKIKTLLNE